MTQSGKVRRNPRILPAAIERERAGEREKGRETSRRHLTARACLKMKPTQERTELGAGTEDS